MIKQCTIKDLTSVSEYLSKKLNIPFSEATKQARKIIKSGLPSLILEEKDLTGVCWAEIRLIDDKKFHYVVMLVNNWRLAEKFIQILRWRLNGIYYFSIPKHDFLNRTYNKNGIRFLKCDNDKNVYCQKFELRTFVNHKSEDTEE